MKIKQISEKEIVKGMQSKLTIVFVLGYVTRNGGWQSMSQSSSISRLLDSKWLKGNKKRGRRWIIKKVIQKTDIEPMMELVT